MILHDEGDWGGGRDWYRFIKIGKHWSMRRKNRQPLLSWGSSTRGRLVHVCICPFKLLLQICVEISRHLETISVAEIWRLAGCRNSIHQCVPDTSTSLAFFVLALTWPTWNVSTTLNKQYNLNETKSRPLRPFKVDTGWIKIFFGSGWGRPQALKHTKTY